jgi:hypothetical protein
MFQGDLVGINSHNAFPMANLFEWFGDRSVNMFYSGFCAYLILQIVLKYRMWSHRPLWGEGDFGAIRRNMYAGLSIFLVPAAFAVHRDVADKLVEIDSEKLFAGQAEFGEVAGQRVFEQTFLADGRAIRQVSLVVGASPVAGANHDSYVMEVLDDTGQRIVQSEGVVIAGVEGAGWRDFTFESISVVKNGRYRIRVTSPAHSSGRGVVWFTSAPDSYRSGQAIVDGIARDADFVFRIVFSK